MALFGELAEDAAASYLSGLLLGAEVREARECLGAEAVAAPVMLLGNETLCGLYGEALALAGLEAERGPENAAARGHWRIAQAAGLVA